MKHDPIVSVCMITYGHEKYIREAIEGILMQECDFEVELVIANDCSPDATDKIVQDLLQNHPRASWIKYIKHQENMGMMPNFVFAMKECKGKYMALCEGDDYWTDPLKLQKQVGFLEANPEYVLSFHNSEVIYSVNDTKHLFIEEYKKEDYTANDILILWLIPTASMVFRNIFEGYFPSFFLKSIHGDLALQVYLNEFGKFKVMDGVMSTYRINESSVSAHTFSGIRYRNNFIEQLKLMNGFFKKKYKSIINRRIFSFYLDNADSYRAKSVVKPLHFIFKALLVQPSLAFVCKERMYNSLKIVFYSMRVFLKIKKIEN
jgi:glycosyltransferase involved in cell wall biosynthesis